MENEKVQTYTLEQETSSLISTDLDYILDTLRNMDFEDDEEFTFKVEKIYTQKEIDELPEFDGF